MNSVRLWGEEEPSEVVEEFMVDYPTEIPDGDKPQKPVPVMIVVVR